MTNLIVATLKACFLKSNTINTKKEREMKYKEREREMFRKSINLIVNLIVYLAIPVTIVNSYR